MTVRQVRAGCIHRGKCLGVEQIKRACCGGQVQAGIFFCAKRGRCTVRRTAGSAIPSCGGCKQFKAK